MKSGRSALTPTRELAPLAPVRGRDTVRSLLTGGHDLTERRILTQLSGDQRMTQRALSRELGIALGLTNLLIRRLVKKGWVRINRISRSRLRYLITPAGLAANSRLTRAYVMESVRFYRETRDHIQGQLAGLQKELQTVDGEPPQIVFFGAGEVAEIAYVCLQDAHLEFVALVDPAWSKSFFHTTVHRPEALSGSTLAGQPFARLVVTTPDNHAQVRATLAERGVPPECVYWL